jgi:hypothetical protein
MQNKKLPPFSKPLFDLLMSGAMPVNSVYLFSGHMAWQKGTAFSKSHPERTMVLPPFHTPFIYYWPVMGCEILFIETDLHERNASEEVIHCLFEHEAEKIIRITHQFETVIYRKESNNEISAR